jgi:predicted ester cyclase
MDSGANKRLVVRFYEEVWARGNGTFAGEVFADDYVRHDLRPTQPAPGAAGQASIAEQFRHAFPDLQWRIDLVLAEDDLVAARWTASGTHTGSWGGLAPTGRRLSSRASTSSASATTARSRRSGTTGTISG